MVAYDGRVVSGLSRSDKSRARGRFVGFVFQSFLLLPSLTALENVLLAVPLRGPGRTGRAPAGGGACSTSSVSMIAATTTRPSSRAASSSAWPSAARCSTIRPCCWPTSPPAIWTMRTGASSWRRCVGGPPRGVPCVVVSHRPEALHGAKTIYRLHAGTVTREGT